MQLNNTPALRGYEIEDMQMRRFDAYAHAKYDILLGWLDALAGGPLNILNVGCGSGELCLLLAQKGHAVLAKIRSLVLIFWSCASLAWPLLLFVRRRAAPTDPRPLARD